MNILDDKANIAKAVGYIKKRESSILKKNDNNNLKNLFDDEDFPLSKVFLVLSFIKVPKIKRQRDLLTVTLKNKVPHQFHDKLSTTVLLLTSNLRNNSKNKSVDYEQSYYAYRDLLSEHNALDLVTEVMPLRQVTSEYHSYESKRNLASRFDIVLCDYRIASLLPHILGKAFFAKNKRPIEVNLKAKNLRNEIESALSKVILNTKLLGSSSSAQVGTTRLTNNQLVENIVTTVEVWKKRLPGGWANVRSIHVKSSSSKALPLYISLTPPSELPNVVNSNLKSDSLLCEDDLSTFDNSKHLVQVYQSGHIAVVNKKSTRRHVPYSKAISDLKVKGKKRPKRQINYEIEELEDEEVFEKGQRDLFEWNHDSDEEESHSVMDKEGSYMMDRDVEAALKPVSKPYKMKKKMKVKY